LALQAQEDPGSCRCGVFVVFSQAYLADVWGYPLSYVCSAGIQVLSIPSLWLARRERADAD
jgi:hypothetical protein